MISYLVIGTCLILLIAVIYISAKPISMGIEARRDLKNYKSEDLNFDNELSKDNNQKVDNLNISDQLIKLKNLKNEGIITEEEFNKAKEKILN
tara:strand:+ start:208 stop:486 length:279 start_codon:yes stop_codon:yes gene_type:complete